VSRALQQIDLLLVIQIVSVLALAMLTYLDTRAEKGSTGKRIRVLIGTVAVIGIATTVADHLESQETNKNFAALQNSSKDLVTGNQRLQTELRDATALNRRLLEQVAALEREQRVMIQSLARTTTDLAGRVSGDGSFVFLQLFPVTVGRSSLSAFRSGSHPVRDVTVSWDDDTHYNRLHDPSAPFSEAVLFQNIAKTRSIFRLGDVGLGFTESRGKPLAEVAYSPDVSEQEFSARITDLQQVHCQYFTLRPNPSQPGRWAVASILTTGGRILHRCLPTDFPGGVPARWSQFRGPAVAEGCLDGQAPNLARLSK
jgi:hypothetical protein